MTKFILGYNELNEEVHEPICEFTQLPVTDLDLEPRGFFKTTTRTISYAIWLIVKNPNIRILINHKNIGKAKEILGEIKGHFESNKRFIHYFGNLVGKKTWEKSNIVISTRKKIYKEPTISVGSPDREATSGHYDVILNDDLVGLKDMISLAERENVLRYYKTLIYLLEPNGWIKNTGTRWHLEDLYKFIISRLPEENVRVRKAYIDDEKTIPLFPHRFPWAKLKKMEEDDPFLFAAQMMNDPTAMKDQLYTLDKLNFFNYETFKDGYCEAYIDPAFGKNEKGDPCFFSMPIVNIVHDKIYVTEWHTNKNSPEQNEQLVVSKVIECKIMRLGIESNAQQSEFIRNIKKELSKQGVIVSIKPINNTVNKDRRIQSMHGSVVNNVYFRDDWSIIKTYREGMQQLTLYPYHKFRDAPDALAGIVSMSTGKKEVRVRYV